MLAAIREALRPVRQSFDELEQRVTALEERAAGTFADVYQGTHQYGRKYRRGDVATFQGSLWLCREDSKDRPGTCEQWVLIVKRGQDASKRGARDER